LHKDFSEKKLRVETQAEKGRVAEAGVADEEDSVSSGNGTSPDAASSADSQSDEENHQVARLPSRFSNSIAVAVIEEVDEPVSVTVSGGNNQVIQDDHHSDWVNHLYNMYLAVVDSEDTKTEGRVAYPTSYLSTPISYPMLDLF